MDKVIEMIKKMLKEGKDEVEIATAVLAMPEAVKMTADQIGEQVHLAMKADDVVAGLADRKRKETENAEAEEKLQKAIERGVNDQLKKMKIDPSVGFLPGKFATEKQLKRFDPLSGELKEIASVDEKYSQANNMLKAHLTKDFSSAMSISKEIDKENAKLKAEAMKTTPIVSDVTTQGGYAIPTEVNAETLQLIYNQSVMYQNCNRTAIAYDSKLMPVAYGIAMSDIANQSTAATEAVLTFSNPTIAMKRMGAFSVISNHMLKIKGVDLLNFVMVAYASAAARFLDLRLAVGNVTNSSDLVDGLLFDANMVLDTEIANADFGLDDMEAQLSAINDEATGRLRFLGNRTMRKKIGNLESANGQFLFPQYLSGGALEPLGVPFVLNTKIPNTLDVGSDKRTTGTDGVLMLVDFTQFYAGISDEIRIDTSEHIFFKEDQLCIRGIQEYGCKLVMGSTEASGGVGRALGILTIS